jgi:inositol-phosphate phosphatase/L-galactose 1-phosphate phosphatase/histidinol-phosphatase
VQSCPAEFIDLAQHLADAARPIALHYFRNENTVEIKSDLTPVTLADRAIEQAWRTIVMERYPDHGIWGEEFGRHQPDASYQWVFDPIDGTKAFTLGRPMFGCLIALYHVEHGFLLGVCDQPVTGDRWVGALGGPTTLNGNVLPQRTMPVDGVPLRAGFTNPTRFDARLQAIHDQLVAARAVIGYGGDCLNFGYIASGFIDISAENKQSFYDVAAFVAILRGVGAVITQGDGTPITPEMGDSVLMTATPELHARFLGITHH